MPSDTAHAELRIQAPAADVLATIHDVASQPEWIPEIREVEVLEVSDDGLALRAALAAATAVGTDRYTLAYEHEPDGIRWVMESGRLQTAQVGVLTAAAAPDDEDATIASYELTIEHPLPLPGFLRSRTMKGLVNGTLEGLRDRHQPTG